MKIALIAQGESQQVMSYLNHSSLIWQELLLQLIHQHLCALLHPKTRQPRPLPTSTKSPPPISSAWYVSGLHQHNNSSFHAAGLASRWLNSLSWGEAGSCISAQSHYLCLAISSTRMPSLLVIIYSPLAHLSSPNRSDCPTGC